jgi:hypothetical protein
MPQIPWLVYYQVLMHGFRMLACSSLPVRYRALVHLESSDNGLQWTALGKQAQDPCDDLRVGLKADEGSTSPAGERLLARLAPPAIAQAGVHLNVAGSFDAP